MKIEQTFYKYGLNPPADIIETASFLALHTFLQQRDASGVMARSVALYFQKQGLLNVLPIDVPIELPPIGLITMRELRLNSTTEQLMICLRATAASAVTAFKVD